MSRDGCGDEASVLAGPERVLNQTFDKSNRMFGGDFTYHACFSLEPAVLQHYCYKSPCLCPVCSAPSWIAVQDTNGTTSFLPRQLFDAHGITFNTPVLTLQCSSFDHQFLTSATLRRARSHLQYGLSLLTSPWILGRRTYQSSATPSAPMVCCGIFARGRIAIMIPT